MKIHFRNKAWLVLALAFAQRGVIAQSTAGATSTATPSTATPSTNAPSAPAAQGAAPAKAPAQSAAAPDGALTGYANSEMPSWLKLSGEIRERMETLEGVSFLSAGNTYLLQRIRMSLAITPLSWLRFFFQAQDSRVYFTNVSPHPSSQQDPVDLRIGYVELGKGEEGPVSFRVGRQGLDFGEGRLVADPNWSNVGKSFDAARLTLRHGKFKLDAFTGASDKIYINGFATPTPGEHFDGLYGSLENVVPNATIQPYTFWKMEHNIKGELVKKGDLSEWTTGIRWVGKLPLGFDYGMESALQRGTQATERIAAWATHLTSGFTLPNTQHLPRFFVEFNRGSGDNNPKDGVHGTFDTLFPSAHDKFGVADQFGWANIMHAREGFQYRVRPGLTFGLADNSFWLANQRDGIYSSGKLIIASNGKEGNYIGNEPDFQAHWSATSRTVVDFTVGHIFTGEFLQDTGHRTAFNSVVLGATQRF
jgi:hypothetical protein